MSINPVYCSTLNNKLQVYTVQRVMLQTILAQYGETIVENNFLCYNLGERKKEV